ncbi:MAG: DNA cytosine methyltransferase [Candidatus Omnitrophica bacterium]|nr:DNA cytosine methyltransferase [Candidatus Omnitrophota bacterium]
MFSGIEAATVAWHGTGLDPVAFAEIEDFPSALLAHRFPGVPNLGDVTKIDGHALVQQYGKIDLVVGGSPCQDLSVAGNQKGLKHGSGTRSSLFYQQVRIAEEVGAEWVLWENVPGAFSSNGGRDFAAVLARFCGVQFPVPAHGWQNSGVAAGGRGGWGVAWRVLDAQYVGGCPVHVAERGIGPVPQRRRRVFLVARAGGEWRAPAEVLLDAACLPRDPPPRRKAGKKAARAAEAGAAGGDVAAVSSGRGWWSESDVAATLRSQDSVTKADTLIPTTAAFNITPESGQGADLQATPAEVAMGLSATNMSEKTDRITAVVQHVTEEVSRPLMSASDNPASHRKKNGTDRETLVVVQANHRVIPPLMARSSRGGSQPLSMGYQTDEHIAVQAITAKGNGDAYLSDVNGALGCAGGQPGQGYPAVLCFDQGGIQLEHRQDGVANCLRGSNGGRAGMGVGAVALPDSLVVRRLTPMECERLQGFPDLWTLVPFNGKPASDSVRYKALGNSMAIPCMRWLGQRLLFVSTRSTPED